MSVAKPTSLFSKVETNISDFLNVSTYRQVGQLYMDLVKRYFNRDTWFPANQGTKSYERDIQQIKKLLEISLQLETQYNVYIKAQFEILAPWLVKKTGKSKKAFLHFSTMTTAKAILRYEEWEARLNSRVKLSQEYIREYFNDNLTHIRSQFVSSIGKYLTRLLEYPELEEATAIKELEMLVRMNAIDPIYLYLHPLNSSSEYLIKAHNAMESELKSFQKDAILRIRAELVRGIEGTVLKYV